MLELILFAAWCFVVAVAGGVVGLVLGNIRLPATLAVSATVAAGTGANLIVSAVAAATASIAHIRAGRVNWRLFAWMAPPSVAGALAGGYLSGELPREVLLGVIAAVLLHASFEMFRFKPRRLVATDGSFDESEVDKRAAAIAGGVIGVLGGVVGLILGSLRMPALIKYAHVPAPRAAGTNITVGVLVGVAGAVGHLASVPPDWEIAAVGSAASIPGALLGSRLTGRLSEPQLIRVLAWLLLVVAASIALEAVTGAR